MFIGDVAAIEPNQWVLAISLNPKKHRDRWFWERREPWTPRLYWNYQVHYLEHPEWWNMRFHVNVTKLAARSMQMPAEKWSDIFAFGRERIVFMEVCPYMSDRWALGEDAVRKLATEDIGFQAEEQMLKTLATEAHPALILINGNDAVSRFAEVYAKEWIHDDVKYPSVSRPRKNFWEWKGLFRANGVEIPTVGFPFLRSIGGHNTNEEQQQLADRIRDYIARH